MLVCLRALLLFLNLPMRLHSLFSSIYNALVGPLLSIGSGFLTGSVYFGAQHRSDLPQSAIMFLLSLVQHLESEHVVGPSGWELVALGHYFLG